MRIAFVSQIYDMVAPPRQNSVGIWTWEVAQRLGAEHDVRILARRGRGEPALRRHGVIDVELVGCAPPRVWSAVARLRTRVRSDATPFFAGPLFARDYVWNCLRRLRAFEPDVIHVQNFVQHLPAYRRAFPRAVLVLHMHCDWLVELDETTTGRALQAADLVVGCSRHVTEAARRRFAGLPIRLAELPNATRLPDAAPRPARERGETVLFAGRVSPEKGVHVLLEAWPRIRAARPRAKLEIVGPIGAAPRDLLVDLSTDPEVRNLARFYPGGADERGAYFSHLRNLVPPDLAESISFAGFRPHREVLDHYGSAALVVSPSLSESFGMSLIEALAAGTPVVATRVGGMPEVLETTGGGVLVGKADPEALARAVIDLLADIEARDALARTGRDRVAALYSWERIAELTEALYAEATGPARYTQVEAGEDRTPPGR